MQLNNIISFAIIAQITAAYYMSGTTGLWDIGNVGDVAPEDGGDCQNIPETQEACGTSKLGTRSVTVIYKCEKQKDDTLRLTRTQHCGWTKFMFRASDTQCQRNLLDVTDPISKTYGSRPPGQAVCVTPEHNVSPTS
jgi:hypothetical protein